MLFHPSAPIPHGRSSKPAGLVAWLRAAWTQWVALRRSASLQWRVKPTPDTGVPTPAARVERRILIAGDSAALGWGATSPDHAMAGLLAHDFPAAGVCRVARAGARLRDVIGQLERGRAALDRDEHYDLVLVIAGGNDALHWSRRSRLRRDADAVVAAMLALSPHAVWLGPANVSLLPLFVAPFDHWMAARVAAVVEAIAGATATNDCRFIDFFAARDEDVFSRDVARYYAPDLVHPADAAYAHCYETVRSRVPLQRWLGIGDATT